MVLACLREEPGLVSKFALLALKEMAISLFDSGHHVPALRESPSERNSSSAVKSVR